MGNPEITVQAAKEKLASYLQTPEGREKLRAIKNKGRYLSAGGGFALTGVTHLQSFRDWYWCLYGFELPPHAVKWAEAMIAEFDKPGEEIRGVLNKAFRGSAKSYVQIAFALWLHGHFPEGSGLIAQDSDDNAKPTARFMSDTISSSVAWKECFPHVVPDEDRGWSLAGYNIKDTRVPYGEWIDRTTKDHGRHPSFNAVSIVTGAIGSHPTLYLMLDDIHQQKNTASQAEKAAIRASLRADVLPTMSKPGRKPFFAVSYTPWSEDDAYADPLERSGMFVQLFTPAFVYDESGDVEFEGQKIKLTWPEGCSLKVLEGWRKLLGKREFGRMYACNLDVGKGEALKYYVFGKEAINFGWPMIGGADPTNVDKPAHTDQRNRSSFALAYVAKLPQGGAVVADGVLTPCSQIEAENYILSAQSKFVGWQFCAVEGTGGGAGFIQTVRRNPKIKIVDSDLSGLLKKEGRIRSKRDRIFREMAPWFENGVVRVSDDRTPFLDALRRGFDKFFELDDHDEAWDALDSVYHALKAMPDVLQINAFGDELPTVARKQRSSSPIAGIGASDGY